MSTAATNSSPPRILRELSVTDRVGVHPVTLWRWERDGHFPRRVKLGAHAVGWLESEVDKWIRDRAEDRS